MSMNAALLESDVMEERFDFGPREFRNAMGQFATGVVVISNNNDGNTHAMTANAFMSGSLRPPMIVVSVGHTTHMHKKFRRTKMFGISMLSTEQLDASSHFSGRPCEDSVPEFDEIHGVPVVKGSPVSLVAKLRHAYPCGDHTLFVGKVIALDHMDSDKVKPLLFHGGKYADLVLKK